ncbi:hypothetical protein Cyrtocomes_00330 [Candidatus Cyrtobacter comes]|uniref:Uncharacterized protein n=1 Tax=Candidatus Cyrtobacter comes TaxID=675776 RepID=A0ABU5L765_9RICK|nr:hypothetical protein [Candidatus Cyrtobacter comes]MDZ5761966.1 hypothetical protein [Candidatus Cyrtobacter comes]
MFAVRCEEKTLCYSSRAKSRYKQKVWNSHLGADNTKTLPDKGICNRNCCVIGNKNTRIILTTKKCDFALLCKIPSALFINIGKGGFCCKNSLKNIGVDEISKYGTISIWLGERGIKVKYATSTLR